ncbi:MAG: N-acetylmuramoyl-L-alanine amidase [Oceanococcus sp.]
MRMWIKLWLVALCLPSMAANAVSIGDVRIWDEPGQTRVVLDLTDAVKHSSFALDKPNRAVIDIRGVYQLPKSNPSNAGVIQAVRFGQRDNGLRLVLDLNQSAEPRSYLLAPSGDFGYRLVVELPHGKRASPAVVSLAKKDIVVAIDAGHGGEDPGATGPRGVREKDVALQIAQRLKKLIDAEPGMRAILTREGDYFIALHKRREIAQRHRADLFVSIHADAFRDRSVHGSSVYILSPRGASSEHARMLANRENAADLVGGVEIQDKDEMLASVLLDISQSAAIEASLDLGHRMLQQLGDLGKLHKKSVQRAGFAVLKAPDVPSILVETAFISNRNEETRLKDPKQQEKLARGLRNGILSYFETYRPQKVVASAAR